MTQITILTFGFLFIIPIILIFIKSNKIEKLQKIMKEEKEKFLNNQTNNYQQASLNYIKELKNI